MSVSVAVERLLPREHFSRLAVTREQYGRSIEVVAFGRRLVIDLVY